MSSREALQKAIDMGLDLIEINGRSRPPIVKIADYGKFAYDEKKKAKAITRQKPRFICLNDSNHFNNPVVFYTNLLSKLKRFLFSSFF